MHTYIHTYIHTSLGGLLIMTVVRIFLTLIASNILVPAGIFMPVFLIGGILGMYVYMYIYIYIYIYMYIYIYIYI
jgi:H+/Cl- antiporter ClcA